VLSPVTGLFCHRRLAEDSTKLDASVGAPGPHDFTVRINAARQRHLRVHRIPHPTFVTIAKRPSCGQRDGGMVSTISDFPKGKYFGAKVWTTQINLIPLTKLVFTRTPFGAVFDRMREVHSENLISPCCVGRINWRISALVHIAG
jgi:hypothetical protein